MVKHNPPRRALTHATPAATPQTNDAVACAHHGSLDCGPCHPPTAPCSPLAHISPMHPTCGHQSIGPIHPHYPSEPALTIQIHLLDDVGQLPVSRLLTKCEQPLRPSLTLRPPLSPFKSTSLIMSASSPSVGSCPSVNSAWPRSFAVITPSPSLSNCLNVSRLPRSSRTCRMGRREVGAHTACLGGAQSHEGSEGGRGLHSARQRPMQPACLSGGRGQSMQPAPSVPHAACLLCGWSALAWVPTPRPKPDPR